MAHGHFGDDVIHQVSRRLRHTPRPSIGAQVTVNGRIVRRMHTTNGTMSSSVHEDLHVGLAGEALRSLKIVWPWGDSRPQTIQFDEPVRDLLVCIDRKAGIVPCD